MAKAVKTDSSHYLTDMARVSETQHKSVIPTDVSGVSFGDEGLWPAAEKRGNWVYKRIAHTGDPEYLFNQQALARVWHARIFEAITQYDSLSLLIIIVIKCQLNGLSIAKNWLRTASP